MKISDDFDEPMPELWDACDRQIFAWGFNPRLKAEVG
jgi:hypothetical protein